jgi:ADP-ribose pyrophosphatase
MEDAKELSVQRIHSGRIVTLEVKEVRLPGGAVTRLEIVHHPGAAAVVPLHEDGSVSLVFQYRHAAGGYLYEIPAGLLEEGETPEGCARRELTEEAGLHADKWVPLTAYHTTPGFSDEVIHLFLATALSDGIQALEEDEVIDVVRMPLADALERIRTGAITDGKTIIALLMTAELQRDT